MEGERWSVLYRVVADEGSRRPSAKRYRYADATILPVLLWAALHDRPRCWACDAAAWAGCPAGGRPAALPSPATVSRGAHTVGVLGLLDQALARLAVHPPALARRVDGKPTPAGGRSNDADARWGRVADHKARGYKGFLVWGGGVVPDARRAGPMNEPEVEAAKRMVPGLAGGGYLLGDALYDSNPPHAVADAHGFQRVAPRKDPGVGLGHCRHEPGRLRSIGLLETPAAGPRSPGTRTPSGPGSSGTSAGGAASAAGWPRFRRGSAPRTGSPAGPG